LLSVFVIVSKGWIVSFSLHRQTLAFNILCTAGKQPLFINAPKRNCMPRLALPSPEPLHALVCSAVIQQSWPASRTTLGRPLSCCTPHARRGLHTGSYQAPH
jgi:hypothetical protein